jgi:hypothetical protein
MAELADKYELWGTFSVWDHQKPGAFLAEVIMYDGLIIPVPVDPRKAQSKDERVFAGEEWTRWERAGWQPERLTQLMTILAPVAEPVFWDLEHQQEWQSQYEQYESSRPAAAALVANILRGWVTGQVLLRWLPAKARGAVAVAPFSSLDELKGELGISETDTLAERQALSSALPGNLVSAVLGREFLVPSDPDRDEFYLLREAVDLVQDEDYRLARRALHASTLQFIDGGRTDIDSIQTAVEAMDSAVATLHRLARRRRIGNVVRRALFFTQVATDIAAAPVNPLAAGRAAISIGQFTTTEWLGNPADQSQARPAGALLYDAQRKLNLTPRGERRKDRRINSSAPQPNSSSSRIMGDTGEPT